MRALDESLRLARALPPHNSSQIEASLGHRGQTMLQVTRFSVPPTKQLSPLGAAPLALCAPVKRPVAKGDGKPK